MENTTGKAAMLIVDDVEINRVILAQFFKNDYTIFEAGNGREALDFMMENKIDVILLDLVMPIMDGFEFLSHMKRDARFSSIPVIATTAQSEGENEVKAMEMGAADFISKPYSPTVVRMRVRNVMARMENEWRKVEQTAQNQQIVEMQRLIEQDALTGIYDRESFCRKASALLQRDAGTRYAIIYLDISYFKIINDLFGMETGNLILKTAGAYFQHVAEGNGLAGRMEADHFALCLPLDSLNMEALIQGLDGAVQSLAIRHNILFYAGVYPVSNVFLTVDQMCDRAHMAMNTVKGNYNKRYANYDEDMRALILEEQMILREMEYALEEGQFCIFIQPIYSLKDGRDISGEALVRWIHPLSNMIPPSRFVPLFERNGFIVRLDRFVWEEACKLLSSEKKKYGRVIPISVNVSRLNFYDADLLAFIQSLLKKYSLEPWMFKMEVTESAYTDNPQQILNAIHIFQEAGFQILMDDFGSGYSSLSMLRNAPVNVLKIDMRFVQDIETSHRAAVIMKNIVNMARDLNMGVVIEGVETKDQVDFLREIGCDAIQGFYFARPMPLDQYRERLIGEMAKGDPRIPDFSAQPQGAGLVSGE